jgi:hypothetical protein
MHRGRLPSGHLGEYHTGAKNPQAASGMGVDHFALQLASLVAVYNTEMKLRPDGNRLQRVEVTTVQAQFIELCGN